MRVIMAIAGLVLVLTMMQSGAQAQERDSVFKDYAAFDAFVDHNMMTRDFIPLVKFLGGRDEYTNEELARVQEKFNDIYPVDFRHKTVFLRENMGGGMHREARAYWISDSYVYFYAMTHQRSGELVVINFHMNSSVSKIMDKF